MDFSLDGIFSLLTKDHSYILQAFLIILGTLLLDIVQRRILRRVRQKVEKTKNEWDDAFIDALGRPLSLLILVVGIGFAAEIIGDATGSLMFKALDPLRDTLFVTTLAWFLIRFINRIEKSILANKQKADKTTVDAIGKILRVSVVVTSVLVALQTLGFSISGVLAFGGIGGIAIGFAAKDLLANFFGGLMIFLDRPFAVGDTVMSPDRNIEGTVEKIGWRLTVIRTFDKRPLFVPNSVFATIAVENKSRMLNRRINETIGIRYEDASKMDAIVKKVKEMLLNHPEIDGNQTIIVNFTSFAPSSLDFFIYTFTKTTNWVDFHEIKQDILLKIMEIIEGEKAECAFPTSTLHLKYSETLKNLDRSR